MTVRFVSAAKFRTAAFTRTTFSAPSALPAMMSIEPMSIYVTGDGKRMCTVLVNPASIFRGSICCGPSCMAFAVACAAQIAETIRGR